MRRGVVVVLVLAACADGGQAALPATTSSTPPTTERLSPANRAALDALVAGSPRTLDPAHLDHDTAGHDVWGPVPEPLLDPATAAALDGQWAAAMDAAATLTTPDDAEAAGYQRAAAELPGIGAHFVRWDLVDAPFDPARPAMLLYDESAVRPDRLAGFSYWTRSVSAPPEGFAGTADHWHMHHGFCFVDGMLRDEGVADPADCRGEWLAGTDLWMAHAWVNPELPNPWGRFAPRHPGVCPPPSEPLADFARCPEPLPPAPDHDVVDLNAVWCTIPPG